jgi:hypothetical protein
MGTRDVLVLGLGNTLLADDGVGVHVVRHLAGDPDTPPCLRTPTAGHWDFGSWMLSPDLGPSSSLMPHSFERRPGLCACSTETHLPTMSRAAAA